MKADEIKRRRKALGLTQVGLAKELGVDPMTVSRWERGAMKISEPTARLLKVLKKPARKPRPRG